MILVSYGWFQQIFHWTSPFVVKFKVRTWKIYGLKGISEDNHFLVLILLGIRWDFQYCLSYKILTCQINKLSNNFQIDITSNIFNFTSPQSPNHFLFGSGCGLPVGGFLSCFRPKKPRSCWDKWALYLWPNLISLKFRSGEEGEEGMSWSHATQAIKIHTHLDACFFWCLMLYWLIYIYNEIWIYAYVYSHQVHCRIYFDIMCRIKKIMLFQSFL